MNIDDIKKQLVRDEALRLKPYRDSVGKLTIGIGRNLDDVGISEKEAYILLDNDILSVENDLDHNFPWWRKMDDVRQSVLANMCFNMGVHVLSGFTNTLKAMQDGNYNLAAEGMKNSHWATQVGSRADRLIHMMETGQSV